MDISPERLLIPQNSPFRILSRFSCRLIERPPSLSPIRNHDRYQTRPGHPSFACKRLIGHNPDINHCKKVRASFKEHTPLAKSKAATEESTPPDIPTITVSEVTDYSRRIFRKGDAPLSPLPGTFFLKWSTIERENKRPGLRESRLKASTMDVNFSAKNKLEICHGVRGPAVEH